ncbi:MAG: metalloprotease TldD, partial [Brachymonas sp.]|nr:metalloprotease TldD [Brachymonas sp.]
MNISIANTHKIPAASASNTKQRLALAEALLLAPFDLCRTDLHKVLAAMHTRQIDDADLYFQSTCSEGWSLEEGIVKSGSFSIDQGVGVRAMSGEKTAFAYSDDISQAALMDAVRNVRTIGCANGTACSTAKGSKRQAATPAKERTAAARNLYAAFNPIISLDSAAKVALLERVEKMARAKDPRIKQVMASVAAQYDVVLVARL